MIAMHLRGHGGHGGGHGSGGRGGHAHSGHAPESSEPAAGPMESADAGLGHGEGHPHEAHSRGGW
jgi:hypothetical protein